MAGGALGRQELQHQIMEITEIIRDDEAALWSGRMTAANSALLRLAISQFKVKLAALKEQLAALGDS
jgi:uncharacterized membrane protein